MWPCGAYDGEQPGLSHAHRLHVRALPQLVERVEHGQRVTLGGHEARVLVAERERAGGAAASFVVHPPAALALEHLPLDIRDAHVSVYPLDFDTQRELRDDNTYISMCSPSDLW